MSVEIIFRAIVIGDGASGKSRMGEETGDDGGSNDGGVVGGDFRNLYEPGFSFYEDVKSDRVEAGDHGIGFPMAELSTLVN